MHHIGPVTRIITLKYRMKGVHRIRCAHLYELENNGRTTNESTRELFDVHTIYTITLYSNEPSAV